MLAAGAVAASDSVFQNNAAITSGGAYALNGALVDHASFTGNQSGRNGGALAITGTLTYDEVISLFPVLLPIIAR